MRKNIINFDCKKINYNDFHKNNKPFNMDNTDTNKILISKRKSCCKKGSFKYEIGYDYHDSLRP